MECDARVSVPLGRFLRQADATGLEFDVRALGEGPTDSGALVDHRPNLAALAILGDEGRAGLHVEDVVLDVAEDPKAVALELQMDREVVVSKMTALEIEKAKGLVKTWLDRFENGR